MPGGLREAVAVAKFDLLVSDIELPDGSGLELMRELRPKGVRGIALSGHGSEDDSRESLAAGFVLHLAKPVLVDVLDEAIWQAAAGLQREYPIATNPGSRSPRDSSELSRSRTVFTARRALRLVSRGTGKRGLAHGPGRSRESRATTKWAGCLSPFSVRSTHA